MTIKGGSWSSPSSSTRMTRDRQLGSRCPVAANEPAQRPASVGRRPERRPKPPSHHPRPVAIRDAVGTGPQLGKPVAAETHRLPRDDDNTKRGPATTGITFCQRLVPILRARGTFGACPSSGPSNPASITNSEPVIARAFMKRETRRPRRRPRARSRAWGRYRRQDRSAISRGVFPSSIARPSFIGVLTPVGQSAITLIL